MYALCATAGVANARPTFGYATCSAHQGTLAMRRIAALVIAPSVRETRHPHCKRREMLTEPQLPSRAVADEREIAEALAAIGRGAPEAMQRLIPEVYGELRRIAHRQLAAERSDHTLSTTAVVREAYLRLIDQRSPVGSDRAHFFALAAGVMRRVLTDYARRHQAARRGGPAASRVALDAADAADAADADADAAGGAGRRRWLQPAPRSDSRQRALSCGNARTRRAAVLSCAAVATGGAPRCLSRHA